MDRPTSVERQTMSLADWPELRLGGLCVSPSRRLISADGIERMIEPRAMQLLLRLAEAPGQTVSRQDLVNDVWQVQFISDDAVNRVAAALRKALADLPETGVTVETVPRVGYRLDVASSSQAQSPASSPGAPLSTDRRHALGMAVLGWGALGLGLGAASLATMRPSRNRRPDVTELLAQAEADLLSLDFDAPIRARGHLEAAVAAAPDNAAAWGKLALAEAWLASRASASNLPAVHEAAHTAADRALALDRRQGDAHAALATLDPFHGEWAEALERVARALTVDPDNLHARSARGRLLLLLGRPRAALALADESLALAPDAPRLRQLRALSLWMAGRARDALEEVEAIPESRRGGALSLVIAWTMAGTGRAEAGEAMLAAAEARFSRPSHVLTSQRLAIRAVRTGSETDAAAAEGALLRVTAFDDESPGGAIFGLAAIGRVDRAFEVARAWYLDRPEHPVEALAARYRRSTQMLFTPQTAGMRADPRFLPLAEEIGLAAAWRATTVTPDFMGKAPLPLPG